MIVPKSVPLRFVKQRLSCLSPDFPSKISQLLLMAILLACGWTCSEMQGKPSGSHLSCGAPRPLLSMGRSHHTVRIKWTICPASLKGLSLCLSTQPGSYTGSHGKARGSPWKPQPPAFPFVVIFRVDWLGPGPFKHVLIGR